MEVIKQLFLGQPTIYDVASYVTIVTLLIVVISLHLKQRTHAKAILDMQARVGPQVKITYDFGDTK